MILDLRWIAVIQGLTSMMLFFDFFSLLILVFAVFTVELGENALNNGFKIGGCQLSLGFLILECVPIG